MGASPKLFYLGNKGWAFNKSGISDQEITLQSRNYNSNDKSTANGPS